MSTERENRARLTARLDQVQAALFEPEVTVVMTDLMEAVRAMDKALADIGLSPGERANGIVGAVANLLVSGT